MFRKPLRGKEEKKYVLELFRGNFHAKEQNIVRLSGFLEKKGRWKKSQQKIPPKQENLAQWYPVFFCSIKGGRGRGGEGGDTSLPIKYLAEQVETIVHYFEQYNRRREIL